MSLSGASAFSAVSGPGCLDRVVTVPGQGGSGGVGSSTVAGVGPTSTVTGAPASPPTALALMATELPSGAMPCGFSTCAPPPTMLFIEIASLGNTCQMPQGATSAPTNFWQLQIGLPAQDQAVGSYQLTDPSVYYEGEQHQVSPSAMSASIATSGSPGAGQGTIQVLSIDKTQVTVRLTGVSLNAPMDGDYVAKRCTPLP